MAEIGVKLFGKLESPFVLRVELALKLKGIEYQHVYGGLPELVAQALKDNIVNEKDPVLVHDGKPIAESLVIIEYIDEIWKGTGPSILPEDPYERAVARFLAKYADDKLMADLIGVYLKVGEEQKKSLEQLRKKQRVFGNALNGNKFFGGDCIGYLDIVLGIIPYWIRAVKQVSDIKEDEDDDVDVVVVDDDDRKLKDLKAWSHNFLSLEMVKEKLPPFDKLIEMLKKAKGKINIQAVCQ